MKLYEALGVEATATADEIKAAYRRKVKETHPDAGGDREKFHQVQHAYEILGDPEKRAAYDRDGDQGKVLCPPPSAILADAFNSVLDIDIGTDPVTGTRMLLDERLRQERDRLKKHEREADRWRKVQARIERNGAIEAILEGVVEHRIEPHLRGAESARAWIEGVTLALKLIANYRYRSDAAREFFELREILEGLDEEEEGTASKPKPRARRRAA